MAMSEKIRTFVSDFKTNLKQTIMQREYKNKFKEHLGVTTDGKPLKFKLFDGDVVEGANNADAFDGFGKDIVAVVLYTKVQHDKGYDSNLFPYDNGLVGWQCMNGFKSIEEAKKDLADRKKLTPKYGVEAYADVFMVTR